MRNLLKDILETIVLSIFIIIITWSIVICIAPNQNKNNDILEQQNDSIKEYVMLNVRVSTYSATKEQCGNDNGITKSGQKVYEGGCAISHDLLDVLQFGDTLELIGTPRDGFYIVNDLCAKHIKNTVDLYLINTKNGGFCERGVIKF